MAACLRLLVFLFFVFTCLSTKQECGSISYKINCGYAGITKNLCEERGCCFNAAEKCFYAAEGVPVKTVQLLQSNHVDIGYADLSVNIVNMYFDTFFPRAWAVGEGLRERNGKETLRWMTQSYLVSLFWDCPAGGHITPYNI